MPLVTLTDLKVWLGITGTDYDARLNAYLDAASTGVEKFLGRTLAAADYTEKYQGSDEQELILNNFPVNSVDSVTIDDSELSESDGDFGIEGETGILFRETGWIKSGYGNYLSGKIDFPKKNIEVSYNAGFATIPADIQMAIKEVISNIFNIKKQGAEVIQSKKVDDVMVSYAAIASGRYFTPEIRALLAPYRKRRF